MRIVSTSYTNTAGFKDPEAWLERISFYTGILEELAKQHDVESIEQINYSGMLERNGVKYHFLNFKRSKLYFPGELHGYIKKLKPDIVLLNGLIFPLQVMQLRLKLGKNVKIILLHRGEKPFRGIRGYLQKLADKRINAYLFTSAAFGNAWIKHGNISSQHKIHEVIQASSVFYPADKHAARSILAVTGSTVFLWVGRLDANKDPVTVVKGFIGFLKYQPTATLYMIYHTEQLLNEVSNLINSDSQAARSIKMVGKIPHRQLQTWFNAADFIISGSHHEGSGIAVCEAMSCGCIPVITDIISFRKMTGPGPQGPEGKCGLLYRPGDDKDLLSALLKTTKMDMEKERNKTLQQFKQELSFEAIAKKIEQVIASA